MIVELIAAATSPMAHVDGLRVQVHPSIADLVDLAGPNALLIPIPCTCRLHKVNTAWIWNSEMTRDGTPQLRFAQDVSPP